MTAEVAAASDTAQVQRRTLRTLVCSQMLGGAGLATGFAVGALIARDLGGTDALSGVPAAAATAGGAGAAIPLSRLMARAGRRPGLALGYATGAVGALVVVTAASVASFALLLVGMAMFGTGTTANLLARYAAADCATPTTRGRALSTVLFATTFGAVAGPNLIAPADALGRDLGLPELAGPFLLSAGAYVAAAVVVMLLLRPDPLLTARAQGAGADASRPAPPTGSVWSLVLRGPALVGLSAMVGAQFVMVAMMTMTPVHMLAHGHDLGVIGFVISVHIAGMYVLAPVGGWLADRVGRAATLQLGAAALLGAGVLGALADPRTVPLLTVALFLLGLGWSLSLVAGSALLTDALPLDRRAQAQGNADLLVGMAGATGGLGSGLVLALSGFAVIALGPAAVAVMLLAAGRRRARAAAA